MRDLRRASCTAATDRISWQHALAQSCRARVVRSQTTTARAHSAAATAHSNLGQPGTAQRVNRATLRSCPTPGGPPQVALMAGTADRGSVARRPGRVAISVRPQQNPTSPSAFRRASGCGRQVCGGPSCAGLPCILVDGRVTGQAGVAAGLVVVVGLFVTLYGVAIVIALVQQRDEARASGGTSRSGRDARSLGTGG
jgi:hypothetical protein